VNFRDKAEELTHGDNKLGSTIDEIDKFMQGVVWRDMESILKSMLDRVRTELELMGSGTGYTPDEVPFALSFFQGQAFQIRTFLDLPGLLKTIKMEAEEDGRRE
jgi:hypothetical protein